MTDTTTTAPAPATPTTADLLAALNRIADALDAQNERLLNLSHGVVGVANRIEDLMGCM